jgi:hypothetical protein
MWLLVNIMDKIKRTLFRKEIEEYESLQMELMNMLNDCIARELETKEELTNDLTEQIQFNQLYEEEITRLERELRLMNMIVEAMNLQGGK